MARILGPGAAGDITKPDNAKAATPAPASPTPPATPPAGGGS